MDRLGSDNNSFLVRAYAAEVMCTTGDYSGHDK